MVKACMLTTVDNPFNPFDQFEDWWLFDNEKGYNSCGRLMRIAKIENDFTPKEEAQEIERAIDEIIKYDFLNIDMKVYENSEDNAQSSHQDRS